MGKEQSTGAEDAEPVMETEGRDGTSGIRPGPLLRKGNVGEERVLVEVN